MNDIEMTDAPLAVSQPAPSLVDVDDDSAPERKLYANRGQNTAVPSQEQDAVLEEELAANIDWDSAPLPASIESGQSLRLEALFVQSRALLDNDMSTPSIMKWVNRWVTGARGIEWISDVSFAIVFDSREEALAGLRSLLFEEDADPDIAAIKVALGRLADIYEEPSPDDISLVGRVRPVRPFDESEDGDRLAPFARIALTTDIKPKKASAQSAFYAKHGRQAGKARTILQDRLGNGRARGGRREGRGRPVDDRDAELKRLDAELDALRNGEPTEGDGEEQAMYRSRSHERGRRRYSPGHEQERKTRARADLDAELDAFTGREVTQPADLDPLPVTQNDVFALDTKTEGLRGVWDQAGPLTEAERGDFKGDE